MKKIASFFTALSFLTGLICLTDTAQARNTVVENALKRDSDLSSFYQGLVTTGVIEELQSGTPYTIFAPTNEALALITPEKYPCFYSEQCRAEIADILRNHIVPREVNFKGSYPSTVFSIDKTALNLAEPFKGRYLVAGHRIIGQRQLAGGMLYKVDSLIASPQELASVAQLKYISNGPVPGETSGTQTAPEAGVAKETVTEEKLYYDPSGHAKTITKTTTTTTQTPVTPLPRP